MICTFRPSEGVAWTGRYDRIPGDQSVFHLRNNEVKNRTWPMAERRIKGDRLSYWFDENAAVSELAGAVSRVELRFNGAAGGSFTVNEWGQVIVPSVLGDRRRYFAGVLQGEWHLLDPDDGRRPVSLEDDEDFGCGDPWERPYVGVPYHLSRGRHIYFVHRAPHGDSVQHPPHQDQELIEALLEIRHRGPVKFIVNPFGLVLTKRPTSQEWDEEKWDPVYVGRIDYQQWFAKEDI
jgi:hypothetical protein